MEAHDLLSLKQPSATRWLSLERAVKGVHANWFSLLLELEEEENSRNCPIAKGIRKHIQTYTFPALTHLLSDVLAIVNHMNLTFQKPVVNMTLASLEDLMNGPGKPETEFNKALQDGKFRGFMLEGGQMHRTFGFVCRVHSRAYQIYQKKIPYGTCGSHR